MADLASARQRSSAPFTQIAGQCSKFVDKQYLVPGLGIRDPNLFQKADLLSIIEHIRSRQATHGVEDTFRWKNVVDSSGELELSRYGYNAKAAKTKLASARQKARRKARKKSKAGQGAPEQLAQLDGLIPMPDDRQSRSPTPGQHDAAPAQDGAAMDPNIDPALQQQMPGHQNSPSPEPYNFPLKRITEAEYQQLRTLMTIDLLPVNGPNEGPPEYEILPTMWDEYLQSLEAGVFHRDLGTEGEHREEEIIPEQESEPVRRKRTRRDFMMEEAEKLVGPNPSKRSRATPAVERQQAMQESVPATRKSTRLKK